MTRAQWNGPGLVAGLAALVALLALASLMVGPARLSPAEALAGLFGAIALPRVGWRRWREVMLRAWERGHAMHETVPFHCIYWEELLPLPLSEVRRRLGVPESEEPDTTDWMLSPLGKAMANGYGGPADRDAKRRHLLVAEGLGGVEADPRDLAALVRLPTATWERLAAAVDAGAPEDELRSIAGLPSRSVAA
jgi:hypothetical protein